MLIYSSLPEVQVVQVQGVQPGDLGEPGRVEPGDLLVVLVLDAVPDSLDQLLPGHLLGLPRALHLLGHLGLQAEGHLFGLLGAVVDSQDGALVVHLHQDVPLELLVGLIVVDDQVRHHHILVYCAVLGVSALELEQQVHEEKFLLDVRRGLPVGEVLVPDQHVLLAFLPHDGEGDHELLDIELKPANLQVHEQYILLEDDSDNIEFTIEVEGALEGYLLVVDGELEVDGAAEQDRRGGLRLREDVVPQITAAEGAQPDQQYQSFNNHKHYILIVYRMRDRYEAQSFAGVRAHDGPLHSHHQAGAVEAKERTAPLPLRGHPVHVAEAGVGIADQGPFGVVVGFVPGDARDHHLHDIVDLPSFGAPRGLQRPPPGLGSEVLLQVAHEPVLEDAAVLVAILVNGPEHEAGADGELAGQEKGRNSAGFTCAEVGQIPGLCRIDHRVFVDEGPCDHQPVGKLVQLIQGHRHTDQVLTIVVFGRGDGQINPVTDEPRVLGYGVREQETLLTIPRVGDKPLGVSQRRAGLVIGLLVIPGHSLQLLVVDPQHGHGQRCSTLVDMLGHIGEHPRPVGGVVIAEA